MIIYLLTWDPSVFGGKLVIIILYYCAVQMLNLRQRLNTETFDTTKILLVQLFFFHTWSVDFT